MTRAKVALLTILWSVPILASDQSENALTALSPVVDFGAIDPRNDAPMRSASLMLRSSSPWLLSVVREPSSEALQHGADLQLREADGSWGSLITAPTRGIGGGEPTSREGRRIDLVFRVLTDFKAQPGRYGAQLRLHLNGRPAAATLTISYTILSVSSVTEAAAFPSPAIDPTRAGVYSFSPQICRVVSNIPWTLEASLRATPSVSGATRRLRDGSLRIIIDEREEPLPVAGEWKVIASGPPTDREGLALAVKLAVHITGEEPEGQYVTNLDFRFRRRDLP